MKIVSQYTHPLEGRVYQVVIDDYFLFLRYQNMNAFIYFWMAFYSMMYCRIEQPAHVSKKTKYLANGAYTFAITFLWQAFWELISLIFPFIPITSHDLGDELIGQTVMTLLGIVLFVLWDWGRKQKNDQQDDKKQKHGELKFFILSMLIFVVNGISMYFMPGDRRSWNWDALLHMAIGVIWFVWVDPCRFAMWINIVGWGVVTYFWIPGTFYLFLFAIAILMLMAVETLKKTNKMAGKNNDDLNAVVNSFRYTAQPVLWAAAFLYDLVFPYSYMGKLLFAMGMGLAIYSIWEKYNYGVENIGHKEGSESFHKWIHFFGALGCVSLVVAYVIHRPRAFTITGTEATWSVTAVERAHDATKFWFALTFSLVGHLLTFGLAILARMLNSRYTIVLTTLALLFVTGWGNWLMFRSREIEWFLGGNILYLFGLVSFNSISNRHPARNGYNGVKSEQPLRF